VSSRWSPPTLRRYRSAWLGADALAALALIAVAVPGQMATAQLAGVPVLDGLYAFVAGSLLYALIGSNRQLSVGADSTIAPILATGVASVAAVSTAHYDSVMAAVALIVGALLILVGLLRLGWIAEFLSTSVITGVLAGIAVEIVVRQLPALLGLPSCGTTTIGRSRRAFSQLHHVNGWSVGIGAGVLVVIFIGQRIDRRVPGALIGLVLSVVVVHALGLGSHHGVATLGAVHGRLPRVRLPAASWSDLRHLAGVILTVAFVCIAQTAATVRASTSRGSGPRDFNRDLIGVGAGSVAAGLIGVLPVDASPPNTAIVTASEGRSQLSSVLAAVGVLVVLVAASGQLAQLPQATLGATLVFIATKLFRVSELRAIFRFDRLEFALAAATMATVALVGIEQGVALAMILSLADRTRRAARPNDTILGREPDTDHWIPADVGHSTEQVAGVLVYLVYAPLWYGNADYLQARIRHLVDHANPAVHAVILDANGMSDIDYTGLQALRQLTDDLAHGGVTMEIARASHLVHHDLKHGALLDLLSADHLFVSVDDAVNAVQQRA
jgi:SulP family sulfate permease